METRIRLYTHEQFIHSQIAAIEGALNREVMCEIILNHKEKSSTIEFTASDEEISVLRQDLGYNVLVFDGHRWLPFL